MIEASEEVALFAIALRGICATQEQQLGLVTTESENECVYLLCRTSTTSMFWDLYKDFKAAGGAMKSYTAKLPQTSMHSLALGCSRIHLSHFMQASSGNSLSSNIYLCFK